MPSRRPRATTFPENHILSHDLIEGNYARCGLLSDTELFDDFPARYHAYARREHRWVRGDWQLLPWLGRRVPTTKGWRANPLPLLERWKLLDNLRRSLVPPALLVLLMLGWTVLPGSPWLWTAAALAILAVPFFQSLLGSMVDSVRGRSLSALAQWARGLPAVLGQVVLDIDVPGLSRPCFCSTRSAARWCGCSGRGASCWSGRPPRRPSAACKGGLVHFVTDMWAAPALAIAIGALVFAAATGGTAGGRPFLAAWLLSPVVAFRVSQPRRAVEIALSDAERRALRRIARKTWHFFTTFVGDDDHWLPPDNFQEVPDGRVAHRTSPTKPGSCSSRPWPPTTWATSAWASSWSGSSERSTRLTGWKSTGATSTTGTTPGRCNRSLLGTSRRWTAATCWVAWWRSSRGSWRRPRSLCSGPAVIEGLDRHARAGGRARGRATRGGSRPCSRCRRAI